jgi:general secretion pathway protein J
LSPDNITGFTLLELLISIAIFAVLITTLFGTYAMVFGTSRPMEESTRISQMAGTCLNQILWDLQALRVTPAHLLQKPDSANLSDPLTFTCETDSTGFSKLRFASENHLPFYGSREGGIAEIVYYIQETPQMGKILRRADRLFFHEPFEANEWDPILCSHIRSLDFDFIDSDGDRSDDWNSNLEKFQFATPTAVAIRLELEMGSTRRYFETRVAIPVIRNPMK